ncbi:MAG TPA: cob(I)yrinic acid a,c-diamide adenosyltransferase [Candidatus Copromorpha excrementigallinarum]|uniref:Corrinoid adenosyltransferase n=1 Tax=Candidatus Allocopromorpha excrementigallinarum TaxID=2840742 RepID=A0A9D1L5S8_9FIRM|nr:cob(I)yrinic acid a,c-diamide adenosyltransferase [Candidatus Copromorpha excrementigallinarum]
MVKVYTKTGDKGQTTLYGGKKVSKADMQVEAYGAVDEANAAVGLAVNYSENQAIADLLRLCQSKLIIMSSELASDSRGRQRLKEKINMEDVALLEKAIDVFSEAVEQSSEFTIQGLTKASAYMHVARTAVRRAERAVVRLKTRTPFNEEILMYLNRLSDLLFVISRYEDTVENKT